MKEEIEITSIRLEDNTTITGVVYPHTGNFKLFSDDREMKELTASEVAGLISKRKSEIADNDISPSWYSSEEWYLNDVGWFTIYEKDIVVSEEEDLTLKNININGYYRIWFTYQTLREAFDIVYEAKVLKTHNIIKENQLTSKEEK